MRTRALLVVLSVLAILFAGAAPSLAAQSAATASPYAPLNRPGPALDVPAATLAAALSCHGNPKTGGEPVLLSPATSVTPEQNYSWNYEKAFTAQHRYWCAVTMPFHTFGDIQTAGEYLVYAIRVMHQRAGRPIAVLGHSQGGMSMRWALRFWPDTRPMVADVIGMAGDNHGTTALLACYPGLTECVPGVWQQMAGSKFIAALNSGAETFKGISYTEIYTHTDEVVTPSNGPDPSSALHTGGGQIRNIATQSVCPAEADEHLTVGTVSPTAYALVMDALTHPGPADPARINRSATCGRLYMPYVDPASVNTYLTVFVATPSLLSMQIPDITLSGAPELKQEPALRCYVYASGC